MAKRKLEAELDAVADDRTTSLVKQKPGLKRTAIEGQDAVNEQAEVEKKVKVKKKKKKKTKKQQKRSKHEQKEGKNDSPNSSAHATAKDAEKKVVPTGAFEAKPAGRRERREKKKKDYQKKNRKEERERRPRRHVKADEEAAAKCKHSIAGKLPHEALRQQIIDTCLQMEKSGINQGTSGNVSARVEGGMYITPSGVAYDKMKPADIVFVGWKKKQYFGALLPSSEWQMHFDLYKEREDCLAIVHAHPIYCTTVACLRSDIPAYHYMVGAAGGSSIRCAQYATFGSKELSDNMLTALRDGLKACLLANHGMICFGSSLPSAFKLAVEVENLARQFVLIKSMGGGGQGVVLDSQEMEVILSKFKTYGKQAAELAKMTITDQERAVQLPSYGGSCFCCS